LTMAYTQTHRRIAISTPLGKDVLLLRGFTGSEAISQLFHFDLDLLSESDSIKFQDIVGKNVTLRIFDADGKERHWNGFISRFSQGSQDLRVVGYRAQMVPWLWFLTRTADCRIFQNKTVPDIIKKIFSDLKFQDFELRLYGASTPRDYCVQYRETDFNFVSRLMEEEGIYYYFKHEDGKHVLVLANDPAAHEACPGQEKARCDFRGGAASYDDVLTEWHYHEEFRPGAWAQTDYNFETPSTNLAVSVNGKNSYEIYEYPGEHRVRGEGDKLARIRLQEQTVPSMVSQGSGTCRHFSSGYKFTLEDHYRTDLNKPYLLTAVRHAATQPDYVAGAGSGEELSYQNSFECVPFSTPFRPQRVTPEPFVQGCQTAVVVGPAGEEIYTDKHGRVKVQFHWDREGKKNENSSCWVRVSHPWAGKGWGSISIPRIGQEVVVDFLEGDPDQPIIIGRVYNAEQTPPFGMPGGAMVSGIKSNSTKGGGGYNEISLNDTKGKELIQIHGQYDMASKIEHDQRLQVVNNQSEKIGVDKSSTVGSNKTISVGGIHHETITGNKILHVGGTHTETISGTMTQTVSSSKAETIAVAKALLIGAAYQVGIGAGMNETIGGLKAEEIGGAKVVLVGGLSKELVGASKSTTAAASISEKAGASISETAGASISETAGSNLSEKAGGNISSKAGGNISHDAGGNISGVASGKVGLESGGDFSVSGGANGSFEMASEFTLKCGGASISLSSGGEITIKGTDITIDGSSITIKGSGAVKITGSSVEQN
jgi:type VI secretion system secreted protein VgrG